MELDEHGVALPYDDPEILGEHGLLRRIHPDHIVPNKNLGRDKVSSAAFSESSKHRSTYGGMSVDREEGMRAAGLDPVAGVDCRWGLVRIRAEHIRARGYLIGSVVLPNNPHHANVWHSPKGKPNGKIEVEDNFEWLKKPTGKDL